jgi:hypothetical protein
MSDDFQARARTRDAGSRRAHLLARTHAICRVVHHSSSLRRADFTSERIALLRRRRCFEPKVGFVGRLTVSTCEASSTICCKRAIAKALFCS